MFGDLIVWFLVLCILGWLGRTFGNRKESLEEYQREHPETELDDTFNDMLNTAIKRFGKCFNEASGLFLALLVIGIFAAIIGPERLGTSFSGASSIRVLCTLPLVMLMYFLTTDLAHASNLFTSTCTEHIGEREGAEQEIINCVRIGALIEAIFRGTKLLLFFVVLVLLLLGG